MRSCPQARARSPIPLARTLALALLLLPLLFCPRAAHAQVSEADRQAARELFQAGYQLQQAGSYAEALDKFRRAQAVFSAPTNLLHIAECEAQLGLLVESAETYRGLIAMPLPPGSPAAFSAAQTQGKAELQQVEARIPKVRIEVAPANAQNVGVLIDGQPMNAALLGVDRPIDPGTHKLQVFAPGYAPQEKVVTISEKQSPILVGFTLVPGSAGIIYANPAAAAQTQPLGQPRTVILQQPALPYGQPTYVLPNGQPYPQQYVLQPRPWTPPKHDWTNTGFLFGVRAGVAVPSAQLSSFASTGGGVGIEGYFRFAHKWFVGLVGQHDFYTKGTGATEALSSTLAAASIGFTTNPEGVGFTMDLFGGCRFFSSSASTCAGEGGIGAGVWIAAGKSIRVIPRLEVSGGSASAAGLPSSQSQGGYALFFGGVTVMYNIDIKPKVVVVAEPSAAAPATAEPAKTP